MTKTTITLTSAAMGIAFGFAMFHYIYPWIGGPEEYRAVASAVAGFLIYVASHDEGMKQEAQKRIVDKL